MHPIVMSPAPGERLARHVGDILKFSVAGGPDASPSRRWQARLRTTLGRGAAWRREIIGAQTAHVAPFGTCWHDVPLPWDGHGWSRDFVLTETGFFAAKPYLLDPDGVQHWPDGPDAGVSVLPDWTRSANTIYCAFVRLFGQTRTAARLLPESIESQLAQLEQSGYAVLPPSGTFRDLRRQLPHIVDRLGCRIVHLLPVHPTPTTHARFGRMGSPYAALDLTSVDPALVEFDRASNGVDQFCELTQAAHALGARLFLDIVINHTGWGSRLFEEHPEYFRREPDGRFASPGAWGVVWEDLVELEQREVGLWNLIADALLVWCRRGVDGFRCDAGYKIPTHVWQFIIARVRSEFPETVFLLEGLGGSWDATESLLTLGGMQWAYSELFQNYSGSEVQSYLDYALRQSTRVGTYVHYSETHDNDRLAARGRAWSLLRNRLCALTSVNGGFAFTGGVEWLATEKIRVHQRTGLNWDHPANLILDLARLNQLLADHPAFFDGAVLKRISPDGSDVFALLRTSRDGQSHALVMVNTLLDRSAELSLDPGALPRDIEWPHDLLHPHPPVLNHRGGKWIYTLAAAEAHCLSPEPLPRPGAGKLYRTERARFAWAVQTAARVLPAECLSADTAIPEVASAVAAHPAGWLTAISFLGRPANATQPPLLDLRQAAARAANRDSAPNVVEWRPDHARRVTLVPPGWWLLVSAREGFRVRLEGGGLHPAEYAHAVPVQDGFVAAFAPRNPSRSFRAVITLERFERAHHPIRGELRFLSPSPATDGPLDPEGVALLTNRRGGMARLRLDFGTVRSKYDCALGANLHPDLPVDRHVLVKRVRAWINADGFLSPLDRRNLVRFSEDPAARWTFQANAGDGRTVGVTLDATMPEDRNTTILRFARAASDAPLQTTLILRVDLEDRSFHAETRRNPGADHHFHTHCPPHPSGLGFRFEPALDRQLLVTVDRGTYHPAPEWSEHLAHPVEASRGQVAEGDAYSPGWFQVPLAPGESVTLVLDAEPNPPGAPQPPREGSSPSRPPSNAPSAPTPPAAADPFDRRLHRAAAAFIARRGAGHTVIAGYPWFLDWGRDTLIAARGLLAGGWHREVLGMLDVFGSLAERGTLPNSVFGENASNRDTSDASLCYAVILEEAANRLGRQVLEAPVAPKGPSRLQVVRSLVEGYLAGTPNGIRVDPSSALVWSPSHFTWMDTNHPAGTPREGYPVEIQALWIRALRFLSSNDPSGAEPWSTLAARAADSLNRWFWIDSTGWMADVLHAPPGTPAASAIRDNALRCNMLLCITLGILTGPRARQCVAAALDHLLIPGGVRSLAPLPVSPPLPIHAADGRLLNDPAHPYWGRYEGDEDSCRKPAYHNGTAWTWFLPILCEALAMAWPGDPVARHAARALLGSLDELLVHGCVGHLPEVLDGDAPHAQRGCDAQAWSATEALRVWRWLGS